MIDVRFSHVDARELADIPPVTTWLFDPPYNIGFGYNSHDDDMPEEDYADLVYSSVEAMLSRMAADANLFLVNYPEIAARQLPLIEMAGWRLHQWMTWVYASNMGITDKSFTRASRAVVWFVKGDPMAHIGAVTQPYRNLDDKRIRSLIAGGSNGTHLYDWWPIEMRKNVSKGYAGWANQLPSELVRRLVVTTTERGDWIGDPMAGSGTLLEVGLATGRNVVVNDLDESARPLWDELLKTTTESML